MARKPNGKAAPSGAGAFYRQMRDWHGYLSAFAFLALIFFAATGILLNHPGLLTGEGKPLTDETLTLTAGEIAKIRASEEPGRTLAEIVDEKLPLKGAFQNGDMAGDDVFVRLQGVKGSSNLRGNLVSGETSVMVETMTPVEVMNGLHRGELAGSAWRLWIDVIAAVLLVMGVLGYILFFSLRFRLRTALVLTGLGLVSMVGLYLAVVP